MALHSPLEVTVGRDTPVHIHVSRNSKSKAQALSESLTQEINRTSGRSYADRKADLSVDDLKTNCCDCHKSRRCCSCHRRDEPIDIYGRYGTIHQSFLTPASDEDLERSVRALRVEEASLRDYQRDLADEMDRTRRLRESISHMR